MSEILTSPRPSRFGRALGFRVLSSGSAVPERVVTNADLHVVLFGLGDLRVSDHGGLHRAMEVARKKQSSGAKVLPLFVLDERCLVNFPGCRTASADTGKG